MRIDKIIYTFIFFIFSCGDEKDVITKQISIESEIVEVYLLSQLNDSRGFCLDVIGYKNSADVKKGIQAHTCYSSQGEISVDQGFDEARIALNKFFISHFNVCLVADKIKESASVRLNNCDDTENQKFILQNDGKIQPSSNLSLCLTASENYREGGGGNPVNLIRSLSLEICNNNFSSRQTWGTRSAK
jgi:hypothetical protein